MASASRIVIPYSPRKQFERYHNRTERWAKIVAHRRFGKTVGCVNDLIRDALMVQRKFPVPRCSYIAPTYRQAKDVAWPYLKHFTAGIPGVRVMESELSITLPNDGIVKLYGADNYEAMRGVYNDAVVVDEPADQSPRAWPEVIRPTLSDYQGRATFIGTPKGRNWFFHLGRDDNGSDLSGWLFLSLKASETGILPDGELLSARQMLTPEQYDQEYECSFDATIVGAYYGRDIAQAQADGRVCGVPYDRSAKVWTAWDLGIGDSTAIWFAQLVGREVHLIDYYEASGVGLDHYAKVLSERPYAYGGHIVPHDAAAKELGTGKSRIETLSSLGITTTLCANHRVDDGINAARIMLSRCWFDAKKTYNGLECLKNYRSEYDDKRQTLRPAPVHDWASHGADAFRYLAMHVEKIAPLKPAYYPKQSGSWVTA